MLIVLNLSVNLNYQSYIVLPFFSRETKYILKIDVI